MTIHREYFQGPLPPPAVLEAYERTLAGAADRIFTHAEEQGRHRRTAEMRSLELGFRAEGRGQWLAAAIVMLGMILGAVLIAMSHEIWGFVSLLTPLLGVTGIFVYARREQTQERAQRRRDLLRSQPDP
jgi:uncharacterized membrane protein